MTQLELKADIQNAETLSVMDFTVIDVTLTRTNLAADEELSYVHSNTFPYLKKETVYLILTDAEKERNIFHLQKVEFQDRETKI